MALILTLQIQGQTLDLTDFSKSQESVTVGVGNKCANYNKDVTTTDGTFSLIGVTTIGWVRLRNRAQSVVVSTPTSPRSQSRH
jgi:hypothetical protein